MPLHRDDQYWTGFIHHGQLAEALMVTNTWTSHTAATCFDGGPGHLRDRLDGIPIDVGGDAVSCWAGLMSLSNPQKRKLKALAQRLEPVVYVGKAGVTDELLAVVEQALSDHELIKVKFVAFKEEKESLTAGIATRTHSELVWIIGHVVVLYRVHADPARPHILPDP